MRTDTRMAVTVSKRKWKSTRAVNGWLNEWTAVVGATKKRIAALPYSLDITVQIWLRMVVWHIYTGEAVTNK